MKAINVEGLPEQVAEVMARMVETLREQFHPPVESRPPIALPLWPGRILGDLSREEIYEDAR